MSRKNMLDLFTEVTGNRHGKLSLGDHSDIFPRNVSKEKCVNFIFKGYIFITYIFLGIGVDDSNKNTSLLWKAKDLWLTPMILV